MIEQRQTQQQQQQQKTHITHTQKHEEYKFSNYKKNKRTNVWEREREGKQSVKHQTNEKLMQILESSKMKR